MSLQESAGLTTARTPCSSFPKLPNSQPPPQALPSQTRKLGSKLRDHEIEHKPTIQMHDTGDATDQWIWEFGNWGKSAKC